jgi:hypothetical protein
VDEDGELIHFSNLGFVVLQTLLAALLHYNKHFEIQKPFLILLLIKKN